MAAPRKPRRQSKLSDDHPAAPPVSAEQSGPSETSPAADRPRSQQAKPAADPAAKPRGGKRHKITVYQEPEDTARVRGALLHTMPYEGHRTLSDFVNRAVMREVERLEEQYNQGNPFPAVRSGEIPRGRPMGEG